MAPIRVMNSINNVELTEWFSQNKAALKSVSIAQGGLAIFEDVDIRISNVLALYSGLTS